MVVLNRIYTRTGDDGTTALGSGERRKKYDLRISAYGTLDEVNAVIGLSRLATAGDTLLDPMLARIQNDPNELNKQVSCLVVLNSFVPLSNSTNTFDPTSAVGNVVVNSISGAVSNAFSKLASQRLQTIFKDKSIRVNFNTNFYNGNYLLYVGDASTLNYNRTNLNLSIGKSFLNEKLTMTVGSGSLHCAARSRAVCRFVLGLRAISAISSRP